MVFSREDDYFVGVLQSRIHELWARAHDCEDTVLRALSAMCAACYCGSANVKSPLD